MIPHPARRGKGEAGYSLPEILVTVAIMGIAFTAILSALAVSIRTSRQQTISADANAALVAAAEAVKAADFCDMATPATCPDAFAAYETALLTVDRPDGWTDPFAVTAIVPDTGQSRTVQSVTVQVSAPDGSLTRSLTIAKAAPPPPAPPPVDPPGDVCDNTTVTASAFWFFFGFVLVEVDTPADATLCTPPIRARVVGSGSTTTLGQNAQQPWRWSGWVVAWQCLLPSCSVDLVQGDGSLIMTVPVESGW